MKPRTCSLILSDNIRNPELYFLRDLTSSSVSSWLRPEIDKPWYGGRDFVRLKSDLSRFGGRDLVGD